MCRSGSGGGGQTAKGEETWPASKKEVIWSASNLRPALYISELPCLNSSSEWANQVQLVNPEKRDGMMPCNSVKALMSFAIY